MLPVTGQCGPVLCPEATSLFKQPAQIGHIRDILSREAGRGQFCLMSLINLFNYFSQFFQPFHHGELFLLLFTARKLVIDAVWTNAVAVLPNGYDVQALSWFQRDCPVVLRHARHYIVVRQRPVRPDAAVLYPHIGVLVRKRIAGQRILCKDARMWLTVMVHDVTLVVHHILDSHCRGDHLT